MNEKIFIDKNKKYLKGNIHTHSTNSDGMYSIPELLEIYQNYDFLGITDHNKFCQEKYDKDIILLPGIESSCIYGKDRYVHFNCFIKKNKDVLDQMQYYKTIDELQKDINKLRNNYSIIQLNHPLFSRLLDTEWLQISGYDMIEVYNHKDYSDEYGLYNSEQLIRTLLNHHKKFYVTAGDDFHGPYKRTLNDKCFGGYIMVEAEKEASSILASIKDGKFYATMGPIILDYRLCGNKLKIETSPVQRIIFYSNMRHCKNIYSDMGEDITTGEYTLCGEEYYVWVKIVDASGKIAWAQPIYFEN